MKRTKPPSFPFHSASPALFFSFLGLLLPSSLRAEGRSIFLSPFDPPASLSDGSQTREASPCDCSGDQICCLWQDSDFCCSSLSKCCGSSCCPVDSICCRSRQNNEASCCPSSQYCTPTGQCSLVPVFQVELSFLPLLVGTCVLAFVLCSCACACIMRFNRRRAMLAASLLHNAPDDAYRTFRPQGSYSKSQGVTASILRTFPVLRFQPGCIPEENALCSICLLEYEPDDHLRTLPCKHHFHQTCIDRWLSDHDTCPLCIQVVTQSSAGD
jgi:hypothetical protein